MKFELLPVVDTMLGLYHSPRTMDRFGQYMRILQGDSKKDILLPVTFYNPMGKENVLDKLVELQQLQVEKLAIEIVEEINSDPFIKTVSSTTIKVAVALADDIGGAWTNRYTTDYDSKFNAHDLMNRGFCNPLFWVSETYTSILLKERIADYCYRMAYQLTHAKPTTLKAHLMQEVFVIQNNQFSSSNVSTNAVDLLKDYYYHYKNTSDYGHIFNFFYGDEACKELAFATYGIQLPFSGYQFAKELVFEKQQHLLR